MLNLSIKRAGLAIAVMGLLPIGVHASGVIIGTTTASNITCTNGANPVPCLQQTGVLANSAFSLTDSLDWGAASAPTGMSGFGQAFSMPSTGPAWDARTAGGVGVSVGSMDGSAGMTRIDNDRYYYNGVRWVRSSSLGLTTYAGHFDSIPNVTAGQPYGDHLIGFVTTQPGLALNFDQTVQGVGLRVSVAGTSANVDYTATLSAYDLNNLLVGRYVIDVHGLGGVCLGLNSNGVTAPTPCNDAPFLAYYGGAANIKRVTVTVSSTAAGASGLLVDTLYLEPGGNVAVPEPRLWTLMAGGLLLLWLLRARAKPSNPGNATNAGRFLRLPTQ